MNLKRKLELGITAYIESLKQGKSPLKGYTVFQASNADDRTLPCVMVEAKGSEEIFASGPKNMGLEILVVTQIDDNDNAELPSTPQRRKVRAKHDSALDQINDALDGVTALAGLQGLLNRGANSRPIEGFYFYDITKNDESHAFTDRCFVDSISFVCVLENDDCLSLPPVRCDTTHVTCDNG